MRLAPSWTIDALLEPRRLVPVAVVVLSVAIAEMLLSASLVAVGIDLLLCFIFWLTAPASWRFLCASTKDRPKTLSRVAVGYVLYIAWSAAVMFVFGYAVPEVLGHPWSYFSSVVTQLVTNALYVVGGWGLGRDIELEVTIALERQRAEQLAEEAERAQLMAIKSHLDPHFLFNTLNAIAEWCHESPEAAEAATLKLASMLQIILSGVQTAAWPLAQELELVGLLFELYTVRDPQRYQFEMKIEERPLDIDVPPMILLPLVENSVKHGPALGHSGKVVLHVLSEAQAVRVSISNPGKFMGRRINGQGLSMIERRLALAYKGKATLSVQSVDDETVALLTIPLEARRNTDDESHTSPDR